jgi:hypothetical protein
VSNTWTTAAAAERGLVRADPVRMDQGPDQKTSYDHIVAELESAKSTLSNAADEIKRLEEKIAFARGTGDVGEQARAARAAPEPTPAAPAPRQTLAQMVETALRARTMDLRELAAAVGSTTNAVAPIINEMRRTKKVWNIGSATSARWTWRLGETAPTHAIRDMVKRLISEQPMTTADLVAATGVRAARISGIMVAIQRTETGILDLAGDITKHHHKRWFLVPPSAAAARLPPKVRR